MTDIGEKNPDIGLVENCALQRRGDVGTVTSCPP